MDHSAFREALNAYADTLQQNFASHTPAQPEDQLKRPVQNLLAAIGSGIVTRTEATDVELGGRPDIAVDVNRLLTGHIELKAPGMGGNANRYRDARNKVQWKKFQALPNLIYTDGSEWTLYRSGEQVASVRFRDDVTACGPKAISDDDAARLERLLWVFLSWEPIVPTNPRALAELLAPLARMIRQDVVEGLQDPQSGLSQVARDWRTVLFPNADDEQFADAYAQTLTYALLLARFHGATDADPTLAARALDSGHGLLAAALRVLADYRVRSESEVGLGLEVLQRVVNALDLEALESKSPDPWLYFYEDFLAAYDPRLRNNYGVYYTPPAVIGAQVRLVSEVLTKRFGKPLGFAEEGVTVLDPATGTGAYPLAIMQDSLSRVEDAFGPGMRNVYASRLAEQLYAFEILVGPYAVAHLRLTQLVLQEGGELPADGAHVYLTDTLDTPTLRDLEQHGFLYRRLAKELNRAHKVKTDTRVVVGIGNPPYDRQSRTAEEVQRGVELDGGWVRFGDSSDSGETTGILKAFLDPVVEAGQGSHAKNLYNLYVYFWRWTMWKVFEQTGGPGIVSFITASSYLRGPAFLGMREHMRRTFDELWIIDLEGDNLGARKTENVFAIQTPVAIAMGVRYGAPQPEVPATVRYTRITGTRGEKLTQLDAVQALEDLEWQECGTDWHAPFLPVRAGDFFQWPLLTDLFPWQHSGAQFKRTWPIGETADVLQQRWQAFMAVPGSDRAALFRETRDRKISREYTDPLSTQRMPALDTLPVTEPIPPVVRYAYRSFDRQWAIRDARLGDYLRPQLWTTFSDEQVYLTSLLTGVLGRGPAAVVAAHPPDMDHFRGSFGAKHVVPLWRDSAAAVPNITNGLLRLLGEVYGASVTPTEFFAYAYALLASLDYVDTYSEELTIPGPRIPVTRESGLFRRVAEVGQRLIGWHTYGERLCSAAPRGAARNMVSVPMTAEGYPEDFSYDAETCTIRVGTGSFGPVPEAVWDYRVSGYQVIHNWLKNRMKAPSGRTSSPLDQIRPEQWTGQMTQELLELLWLLEATVQAQDEMSELLADVIASDVFLADELPQPSEAERGAPDTSGQVRLF